MSRSNDLRKLVKSQLDTLCDNVSFKRAAREDLYPHLVFNFERTDLRDLSRKDVTLVVDVWDRSTSAVQCEELADSIEDLLGAGNLPQASILPTFYLESRVNVTDEDKLIQHIYVSFTVQNYERN